MNSSPVVRYDGTFRLTVSPRPSCPDPLAPQHSRVEPRTPQVKSYPALIELQPVPPLNTGPGVFRLTLFPVPSWPALLAPQHHSVLLLLMPQVCAAPAETAFHCE